MKEKYLHILNGDGTFAPFSKSGIPGDVLVWREALAGGPVGAFQSLEELTAVRPFWLETSPEDYLEKVGKAWEDLPSEPDDREVVLWFEYDLFCQVNLAYLVQLLGARGFENLSLVSPDGHSEIPDFRGMGQLMPDHFPELFAQRLRLGRDFIEAGRRIWEAWIAPSPLPLQELRGEVLPGWLHFPAALELHLRLFPETENGLNLIELWVLGNLVNGPLGKGDLFRKFCQDLDRYGWGDFQFFQVVQGLGDLLQENENGYEITLEGRQVVAQIEDRFSISPTAGQLGGLSWGKEGPPFRWDAEKDELIAWVPKT